MSSKTRLSHLSPDTLGFIFEFCDVSTLARLYLSSASIHHGFRETRWVLIGREALTGIQSPFPSFLSAMSGLRGLTLESNALQLIEPPSSFWTRVPPSLTSLRARSDVLRKLLCRPRQEEHAELPSSNPADYDDLDSLLPSLQVLEVISSPYTPIGEGMLAKLPRGLTNLTWTDTNVSVSALALLPRSLTKLLLHAMPMDPGNAKLAIYDCLPTTLTSLTFTLSSGRTRHGLADDMSIFTPHLSSLQELSLPTDYIISSAMLKALPLGLTALKACLAYSSCVSLPPRLTSLNTHIVNSSTQGEILSEEGLSFALQHLPLGLKKLHVGFAPSLPTTFQYLPSTLEFFTVMFIEACSVSLSSMKLPPTLKSLFGANLHLISHSSDILAPLPASLQYIKIANWSGSFQPNVAIGLTSLIISDPCKLDQESLRNLPVNLRYLKLSLHFQHPYTDRIGSSFPRGLRSLHMTAPITFQLPGKQGELERTNPFTSAFYYDLPPSLESLTLLDFHPIDDEGARRLPRTLGTLFLSSTWSTDCPLSSVGVSELPPRLHTFMVDHLMINMRGEDFGQLPRTLRTLTVKRFSKAQDHHIALLPPALEQFVMSSKNLTLSCISNAPFGIRGLLEQRIRSKNHFR